MINPDAKIQAIVNPTQSKEQRMPEMLEHFREEIKEDIKELKEAIKENRGFFQERMDKMDGRIWGLVITIGLSVIGFMANIIFELYKAGAGV